MKTSFITLDRKILHWQWYQNSKIFRVFVHCLIKANWEDKKWIGHKIKRGQHITSTVRLLETLDITFWRVRKALERLKKGGEVIIENPANRYSLVTIVKYEDYQISEVESIKQTALKPHSNRNKQ